MGDCGGPDYRDGDFGGHEYGHGGFGGNHGPSFTDTFVGVELAAGLIGHDISLVDAATIAIAIDVALDHGGPGEFHGYQTASLDNALGALHPGARQPDAPTPPGSLSREVSLPGLARDSSAVEVLFWPHSPCDPQEHVRHLAKLNGLLRYDPAALYPGYTDIDRTERRLLFGEPRQSQEGGHQPPNGWYPGATGKTHIWREFYRIRPGLWPALFGGPTGFDTESTFLIVLGVTWHYQQTNDEETRVAVLIHAHKRVVAQKWVPDEYMVKRCRGQAERLAAALQAYVQKHPASPESVEQRRLAASPPATEAEAEAEPASGGQRVVPLPPEVAVVDWGDGPQVAMVQLDQAIGLLVSGLGLRAGDRENRRAAAIELARIAAEEPDGLSTLRELAVEPLIAALEDEDRDVRRAAADALGDIGQEACEHLFLTLIRVSNEHDASPLFAVARAMGKMGDLRALPVLNGVWRREGEDPAVRAAAIEALEWFDHPVALELATLALTDTEPAVRRAAETVATYLRATLGN